MLAETSLTEIAKRLEVSTGLVHKVINGERRNQRVREAIAEIVSRPVDTIWPAGEGV